ncbi:MAG: hypothetical protein AAFX40_07380 [Cyanobacteria bacterium J06639_1]
MELDEVKAVIQRALADRKLSRDEQNEIMAAVLADGKVSPEEQELLNGLLDKIRQGHIKVVD